MLSRFSFVAASLLLACILHVSPVLAQDTNGSSNEESDKPEAETIVAVDDVADDDAIEGRLNRVFKATTWYQSLEVECDNGIVKLSGISDSAEHRDWAEKLAGRTQDVIAVVNNIEVSPSDPIDLSNSATVVEKSLKDLWTDFLARSPLLIAAFLVVVLTALLSRAISWVLLRLLERRKMRTSLKDLFYQLATIAIWVAGFLVATVVAFPGMTPSKALAVLGLGSVAVGFAFKDIFENFFAGILILVAISIRSRRLHQHG